MLRQRGAVIVDADQVARDVVAPGTQGLAKLVDGFGREILDTSGALDRSRLGAVIFVDAEKRALLERVLHPLIAQESMRQITEALRGQPPWVVYDAALLIESGRADNFRPLLVVTTDRQTQCARLMQRDGLSREDALARMDSQMDLSEKVTYGDFVIDNSGSIEETEKQLDTVLIEIGGSS